MKFLLSFLLLFIVVLSFFNAQITNSFEEDFSGKQVTNFHQLYKETQIEIGMVGDVLLHSPLYNYSSFLPSFQEVEKELKNLDFLLANQESPPAGTTFGLSGYPNFSSPSHIIRDLKAVGVDLISSANNHTLDKKEAGLLAAIETMEANDIPYVGAHKSVEDQQTDRIFEVKGVRLGFLNYTYGLNGHQIPEGKEYLVNLINKEQIKKDIIALKSKVDVVVLSIHWGEEYALEPSEHQKELAKWMAEAGADVIFGHHPHVIQPYERIATSMGETHVFYSLGNFFSAQQFDSTNIGGIAKLQITKRVVQEKVIIRIENPSFTGTIVSKGNPFKVSLLEEANSQKNDWVQQHIFAQ
ncbi:CapA family protein [Psychrobacillus sp. FSL W7-1457]|uniref:CapA family protein n=1 Tax=Psychrobacillus sp. FSL W7-1457 TaxID=2954547 RepID=UPI003159FF36